MHKKAIAEKGDDANENLLAKLKVGLENTGKPMEKLSHVQIMEISNGLAAESLEKICKGEMLPINDSTVEVKVEEVVVNGKKKFWNKAFLVGQNYKVGWILYRDNNICMVCKYDFSINVTAMRNHCRLCGCVLCDNCSTNRFYLPSFPETNGSKVCEKCFNKAEKLKASQPEAFVMPEESDARPTLVDVNEYKQQEAERATLSAASEPKQIKPADFLAKLKEVNASFRK
jgi:hypothetical protein